MYVIVKPTHMNGAEFDYGQFVTSAGAEVIESSSNWNYSRSILFAWAIPYYHFGAKATIPITKTFTAGSAVAGWPRGGRFRTGLARQIKIDAAGALCIALVADVTPCDVEDLCAIVG